MIDMHPWDESALGVDFGTSNTVAVGRLPGGRIRPLLFDGSPVLPSAVLADVPADVSSDVAADGTTGTAGTASSTVAWMTGHDALHGGQSRPGCLEPYPKLRIDDSSVLLGTREVAVAELFTPVLARVAAEAATAMGRPPRRVVLTHPAGWGPHRRAVLTTAATAAGLGHALLVSEPIAAAAYVADRFATGTRPGDRILIYDLGAGTFDVSIVSRTPSGHAVVASDGRTDTGGADIDAALVTFVLRALPAAVAQAINQPTDDGRRARWALWRDVRAAKEMLARTSSTTVYVPTAGRDVLITRDDLDRVAAPVIERTLHATAALLHETRLQPADLAGIFLVGGTSRMPLVATALHRAFPIAPTVTEQPELVVAEGALLTAIRTGAADNGAHLVASLPPVPTPPPPVQPPYAVSPAPAQFPLLASPRAPMPYPTHGQRKVPVLPAGMLPQPAPHEPALWSGSSDRGPSRTVDPQDRKILITVGIFLTVLIVVVAAVVYDNLVTPGPGADPQATPTVIRTSTLPATAAFTAAVDAWRTGSAGPCEIDDNRTPGTWRHRAACNGRGETFPWPEVTIYEFDNTVDLYQFASSNGVGPIASWGTAAPIQPVGRPAPSRYAEANITPYNRYIYWIDPDERILGIYKLKFEDAATYNATPWQEVRRRWANRN